MQTVDPDDPRLRQRPVWGLLILLLPVLGVVIVFALYAGMWTLGTTGRSATGPRAELAFRACPEARDVVAARLADMGLDATFSDSAGGFRVSLTLTGDPEIDRRLPEVLAMPGALEIRGGDEILATGDDVREASVRLDLLMVPAVLLDIDPEAAKRITRHVRADPGGDLNFYIDGDYAGRQANLEPVAVGQLEIAPDQLVVERERMVRVAEWSVVLDHPLPCPVSPDTAPARDR